jgi:cytochrome c553
MDLRAVAAVLAAILSTAAAQAQIVVKGDPAKAQQLVKQVCAGCHGLDGNSTLPANPVIAGQHPEYAYRQLLNFRSVDGKPPERPSPIMTAIVASLTQDDMANLALYFASQKPKPRAAQDADLARLGQEIWRGGIMSKRLAACASCHLPNGAGIPAQFPRLAGQHAQYTVDMLRAFRSGERANDPARMMRAVAEKMSDREIAAVAQYIEGLR